MRTEFAVVGGGLTGLATAWALARLGREVTVLERHEIGHRGGGSHGTCRIFRLGYEDAEYVGLARRARRAWDELEAAADAVLLHPTPQVTFGPMMPEVQAAMTAAGAGCRLLTAADARSLFPGLRADGPALLEPDSAVIAADRALAALSSFAGSRIACDVRSLADDGRRVTLGIAADTTTGTPAAITADTPTGTPTGTTAGTTTGTPTGTTAAITADITTEVVEADVVIVCAGPWTAGLLRPAGIAVPAEATLEQVAYLEPTVPTQDGQPQAGQEHGRAPDRQVPDGRRPAAMPIFVHYGGEFPYGLPVPGSNRYKIGIHHGGPQITPDDQDQEPDPVLSARIEAAARRLLPGFRPEPVAFERCVYDNSPDDDFIVDRIGNVVIGSGTSGHGFKFGPLLGEWLASLATGQDLSPGGGPPARFALRRFRHS